jgi:hypothetical protein
MKKINVGLVGHKFMGRAHTHAITDAPIFFDLGVEIVKKAICSNEESVVEYNPPKGADRLGDLPPPLFAGAVVEKEDGNGRLVVIGSLQFAINTFINFPDLRFQRPVARFPGNAELFCNSVLWLSKMEPMLAISPAAMEVSRIREISPGALQFWRVGVLLIALPGMVILAGILMYFARRD